jgi:replication initiation protein RepC
MQSLAGRDGEVMGKTALAHINMTFTKLSIKQNGAHPVLRETPAAAETDIWAIFRALRDSHTQFGLRPGHMQTLQAMLSFLKPGHGDTVFASNAEICRRVGGIDERTLRRHIYRFVDLGFMKRYDSPNHKRYRVRSSNGECLSYGLSLSPLIERANELVAIALDLENRRRDGIFLRKQILTKLAQLEEFYPESTFPSDLRKVLRRKLSISEYRAILTETNAVCEHLSTAVDAPVATILPANDGQNDRHQSKSKKEDKDLESSMNTELPKVQTLTAVCEQATAFATYSLKTWQDVDGHARTLAPMMGIHPSTYDKASRSVGAQKASCAIFIILQIGSRIRDFGAYFHSITLGRRANQFNPLVLLKRLASSADHPT